MERWTLLAICLVGCVGRGAPGPNLLDQPGFEGVYRDGVAPGWRRFPIRGLVRGECREGSGAHGGAKAQHLEVTELMGAWLQCAAPLRGGIVAGHDYEASVWLRADRQLDHVVLMVHDATEWFPTAYAATSRPIGHAWTEVTLRFRAPRTDPTALMAVKLAQEGQLWIDDASVHELTVADRPAAGRGNAVRNGSFEVGLADWVSYWVTSQPVADAAAPHGATVLRVPGGAPGRELQSAALTVPWGHRYAVTLALRGAAPATVRLRHGRQVLAERVCPVGPAWQQFSLPVNLPPLPDGFCHLAIAPGPGELFVDSVQLTPGDEAGVFAPRASLELGLQLDADVLDPGSAVSGRLLLFHASDQPWRDVLQLRVSDTWEREVLRLPLAVDAPPGPSAVPLKLPPMTTTGSYRIEVDDDGVTLAEALFAVLPRLPADRSMLPALGGQVDYGGDALVARAGATWTKTWLLGWDNVEPEPGQWRFARDGAIDGWLARGLRPLAVLSEAPRRLQDRPADAVGWGWYPATDLTAMTAYARQVAARYQGKIDTWMLQNEPDHALHPPRGVSKAAAYAREALALAEGVRAAQPDARILLGGGVTTSVDAERWLADVAAAEPRLLQLCNGFSYHNYSPEPAATRRIVGRLRATMRELGWEQPLWDAEWCPTLSVASAYRAAPRHLSGHWVTAHRAAALMVQGFVTRLGEGVAGSVLYQSFGPGSMASSGFDLFWEADGAPRPAAVAQAVLATQLAGARPVGSIELAGCWAYRFQRADGSALVIAWAANTAPAPVPLALPGDWRITDLMGVDRGPLTPGTSIDADPLYIAEVRP